ncbi:hypothetical protein GPL15_21795 [Clostridium sp. MCC353]|uniref:hypothetical protein n=1 Tax=Clostridium sp. MCC353 TaxID=2592646 RepID=UPI001C0396FC|nr:hypothetical protein [Clostridium sp. MCC353]MBT9779117.1 hypothetical protein [Clostridium sp. MCC353]
MNPGNGDGRGRRPLGWLAPGGAVSVGDENRLPTVSETKAPGTEKDGAMPIHGKLFMGLYRSVGISETDLVFSFCPSFSIPGA